MVKRHSIYQFEPDAVFEMGYFAGDHYALILDKPDKWFKNSDKTFKGYLLYDKIGRVPCLKWACNVCNITDVDGVFVKRDCISLQPGSYEVFCADLI